LWKDELGCLKDYELELKFQKDAKPVFCKARPVPFAMKEELTHLYDEGIRKGVWEPTDFNDYGTPVVPVRKHATGPSKPKLRVCGDYSCTVNPQLEDNRHPLPLPDELLQKLGGSCCFSKIDLADAYNQIKLGPVSQRRLALSTHRGVLLQKRLPFGPKSAVGEFQAIMERLAGDLPGVVFYLDDYLVGGNTAEEHLNNLRRLLQRLNDKGLRCRREKCQFALPSIEYLGHQLSRQGIAKGSRIDAVREMPPPHDVTSLRSFLGSVQFYGKFLPSNMATITEPLYRLTRKGVTWAWGEEEKQAFQRVKTELSSDNVLVHFNPDLPLGISCDASSVGIGAVLFHRYPDGSERPIANASKVLTEAQQRYPQIQKEALSIVFALKKFYQYLFNRKFILVTDHQPLLSLFGPNKETPVMAANRLARWANFIHNFSYTVEYRKTGQHGNADALSRLPVGDDPKFDGEESTEDSDMVCAIKVLSLQLRPSDSESIAKESTKDPVISTVLRYCREGWPLNKQDEDAEVARFRKIKDSLNYSGDCLLHGCRLVIPRKLRENILNILHLGHFGMVKMKQLARTVVYWPNIDDDIESLCRKCSSCAEHQNLPPKAAIHPWMVPEKPWSRVHIDHAVNFLGSNWLVLTDSYSKYPCIHATQSLSTRSTIDILEEDFAHFGYPHAVVTDNAATFMAEEFKAWCHENGIVHLTGAPYHPATNGAAERLVQTFKKALRKSDLPPRRALQRFLMQYRRTPTATGYSPSELLNRRQIRTKIDTLLPSPTHLAQDYQVKQTVNVNSRSSAPQEKRYNLGDAVYACYYGPRRSKEGRWVPAVIVKVHGSRSVDVKVVPKGPTWRRHYDQLRPRYASPEDTEPGDQPSLPEDPFIPPTPMLHQERPQAAEAPQGNDQVLRSPPYGPGNVRRSKRQRKPPERLDL
jgi:hypothetical protein